MSNDSFVEITPTQTHIVVLANKRLVIQIEDAQSVMLNGASLALVSAEKHLWSWHTQRRIGRHVLVITRTTHVQIVSVECIAESVHHDVLIALRTQLLAIDERLCVGQRSWHTTGIDHAVFVALIGMPIDEFIHTILRYLYALPPHALHEWQGDSPAQLRVDRVVVRDATIVPLAYHANTQPRQQAVISMLLQMLLSLESDAEYHVRELIHQVRQRLLMPVHIAQGLADIVMRAHAALEQSRRPSAHGALQHTADVALLYERWVWVTVLRALGCSDAHVRQLIDGNGEYYSDSGVICAYQRRLTTTPHPTGWSRDGRVAVPDVMVWQATDAHAIRACIIDAKCSFDVNGPDHTAQNDVTAYLRRIGVGDANPDVAILVHPGSGSHIWPSGLIVVGTDGVQDAHVRRMVQAWVARQI